MPKEYLGDSVYAELDSYGIVLTTENGSPSDPSNTICLDDVTLRNLIKFASDNNLIPK